jgi:hypothetical protein
MLGSRRTIPFWRQKRRLLPLERALEADRKGAGKSSMTAQAVADARSRDRLAAEARQKARFSES